MKQRQRGGHKCILKPASKRGSRVQAFFRIERPCNPLSLEAEYLKLLRTTLSLASGDPAVTAHNFANPAPYYAVIFTSTRKVETDDGYAETAARMEELARLQPGFLGIESARGGDGLGITVSYWASEDAIRAWSRHAEHLVAQRPGRQRWYEWFAVRICKVERARFFTSLIEGETDGRHAADDRRV